jgi:HK97 family phage portal protein
MTDSDDTAAKIRVSNLGGPSRSKAQTSTQLAERRVRELGYGVEPPYNPDRLAGFIELNETHSTAIRKKSRYEVGFGFEVAPHRDVDPEEADDVGKRVVQNFWRGRDSRWLTGPSNREPTTPVEVLELGRQDYHGIGWKCYEILTNAKGVPTGLAYVPANTIRIRKPQSRFDQPRHPEDGRFVDSDRADVASRGYVQIRNGRRRYFGEAGDRYRGLEPNVGVTGDDVTVTYTDDGTDEEPVFVDRETGDVVTGSAEGLDNSPANELIFIRNPSPLEQDYGVPDWVAAIRTISSDEAAKDYNRDFFRNDTIPRMVIKVTGGELTEESRNDLEQMLHGLRDEDHRTAVLEVEKFESQLDEDVQIELVPVGQGISEEMDFREYRAKNEHEIAKVHEVPPVLIGVTETSNRSNSKAQVREFAKEVVEPEQHKLAARLYQIIHQQAFGVTDWTIEFKLRGADQPAEEAKLSEQRVRAMRLAGVGTVDEARQELGLDPLGPPLGEMTLAEFESEMQAGGNDTDAQRSAAEPPPENKVGERDWAAVRPELDSKQLIETMQFSSSNLDEGLYDYEESELYLSFLRADGQSSLYAYTDLPEDEWNALTDAGSHGSYHYDNIRLEYPYIEITNFHDRLPEGPVPEDPPDDIPSQV